MRPGELIVIVLCTLTLGLQLQDIALRSNRTNCRPTTSRPAAGANGRLVF